MKRALHGGPLPTGQPMCEIAALELRIEEAWLRLTNRRGMRKVTLYLTERFAIAGLAPYEPVKAAQEIGTYTSDCTLAALREDVFDVFEKMRRSA